MPAPTVTSVSINFGPYNGGTSIKVFGTGFLSSPVQYIQFLDANPPGSTPTRQTTSFFVVSDTELVMIVPPIQIIPNSQTWDVDVVVTTLAGSSARNSGDIFTYWIAPTDLVISPDNGPAGGGTQVAITGFNIGGVAAVAFGNVAAQFTLLSTTELVAVSPPQPAGTVVPINLTLIFNTSQFTGQTPVFAYTSVTPPTAGDGEALIAASALVVGGPPVFMGSGTSQVTFPECLLLTVDEVAILVQEGWTVLSGPWPDQASCMTVCPPIPQPILPCSGCDNLPISWCISFPGIQLNTLGLPFYCGPGGSAAVFALSHGITMSFSHQDTFGVVWTSGKVQWNDPDDGSFMVVSMGLSCLTGYWAIYLQAPPLNAVAAIYSRSTPITCTPDNLIQHALGSCSDGTGFFTNWPAHPTIVAGECNPAPGLAQIDVNVQVVASSPMPSEASINATASVVASETGTAEGTITASAVAVVNLSLASGQGGITAAATLMTSNVTPAEAGIAAAASEVASSLQAGEAGVQASAVVVASDIEAGAAGIGASATFVASSLAAGEAGIQGSISATVPTNLVSGSAGIKAAFTVLLSDQFTDTNGTALTSHTMNVGSGWTSINGTWSINASNQANNTNNGGTGGLQCDIVANAGSTSTNAGTVASVQVTTPSSGSFAGGLVLWATSNVTTTHYYLYPNSVDGKLELFDQTGTMVASAVFSFASNTTYTIAAQWDGTHILGFVNGSQKFSYTPGAAPSNTYFGLHEFRNTLQPWNSNIFDNFMVYN